MARAVASLLLPKGIAHRGGDRVSRKPLLFAGLHIFERHLAALALLRADDRDKSHAARCGILELLSDFIRFRVEINTQPCRTQFAC